MRFQSNLTGGEFSPINLAADFPVSEPHRDLREDVSPIAPHVHDCFELGYCYEGSGIFLVENKILAYRAGDAVVINHRELHLMQGKRETPAKWDFINLDPAGMLANCVCEEEQFLNTEKFCGPSFPNIIHAQDHPDLCAIIREIIEELLQRREGYRSLVRARVWALLVKLHRLIPDSSSRPVYNRKKLEQIQPALVQIAAGYGEELAIDVLARRCCTSVANFRKLFHAAVGMSPITYIKQLRLKVAAVLLTSTERSILDIALASGYPTLSNFNRHFREAYNQSPREYRKAGSTTSLPAGDDKSSD